MKDSILRIGIRYSKLAVKQAESVKAQLIKLGFKGTIELVKISSSSDTIPDLPARVGEKGLFIKEIEKALLEKEINLAVHSMKDVPIQITEGLCIGAITERRDARDVLVSEGNTILKHLSKEAVIGTSSLRRRIQILNYCPSFQVVQLRGSLEERLRRVGGGGIDAIIISAAGIHYMGEQTMITEYLPTDFFLPAIGQGALGIQIRKDDTAMKELIEPLNHQNTDLEVKAERAFFRKLGGGCQAPIACLAQIKDHIITINGLIGNVKGKEDIIRDSIRGYYLEGEEMAIALAEQIISQGANKILKKTMMQQ
ncbi:MAG: hydroxymethylbilane synthase [bacterium]